MTNTSEKTRAAALAFLEAVARHFYKNPMSQMPEFINDAGLTLLNAVEMDEAEAEKMRAAITSITNELELVHFELEDTHQAMRFNLKKNPIVELDS
jgi:hypothetical protein